MKILIIQTAFIGDVILATAMIEKLHEQHPDAKIDFLVRKGNESLLNNHPKLNEVLIFDKSSKYKNLLRLIRRIRGERYDYVINAQRFFTTGLITVLSEGKVKIGFDKNPLSFLFSTSVKHEIGEWHEVDRNQLLIESLTETSAANPKLYPSAKDEEVASTYIRDEFICIAPTSVWFTKQFHKQGWIEFINQVPEDITIYLLGAPGDAEACEEIKKASTNDDVVSLAGKLSLLQSAALMKHAKMNYVNDSAPMHLCSAVNASVTAVYCSTVPEFGFGPLSDDSHVVEVEEKLDCRPCGLHGHRACPKGHFWCATDIKTSQLTDVLN